MYETIWTFKTKRFTVRVLAEPDYADLDLSWDETGEVKEKIESGEFTPYTVKALIELDGNEIASDYLGGCIYANISEFRDHVGSQGKHGSYFTDMVSNVVTEARKSLSNVPRVRIIT